MKVLYCTRDDYTKRLGGDTTQLLNTIKYIKSNYDDFQYAIVTTPSEIKNHLDSDIVHIFNMQNIDLLRGFVDEAERHSLKIALSTIYWDLSDSIYVERMFKITNAFCIVSCFRFLKKILILNHPSKRYMGFRYRKDYHEVLNRVGLFLPNSPEEWSIIKKFFYIDNAFFKVVPNALEKRIKKESEVTKDNIRDSIIVVGRIEPTKNQLGVLLACMDNNIPIIFVGDFVSKKYERVVRKIANKRGNVKFVSRIPQDEVYKYYQKAKVHVLASFRESPGLVTLEAMRAGCNIVVSQKEYCPISYYQLDKYGYVCNPYSISSIRESISKAFCSPTVFVPDGYFDYYSYENAAEITINAYKDYISVLS